MKKFNLKKTVAVVLTAAAITGCFSGCNLKGGKSNGKVQLTVSNWPADTSVTNKALYESWKAKMEEKYPNIEVVPDKSVYDPKTFFAKASSGQLPTIILTPLTELDKIVDAGYAADLTSYMEKYKYTESMNPTLREFVTRDNKLWALPTNIYAMGLYCNRKLFEKAGLVNSDGTLMYPKTYDELIQTAKTITEKTGEAGFATGTMNNTGGWLFMNIAWSFGVDFMEEKNGKYVATFDSQECIDAINYIKDLKWKYNVLPSNTLIDQAELRKLYALGKVGMVFTAPPDNALVRDYNMSIDDQYVVRVPEGPAGRYAQMGGNLYMISNTATDEEIDAAFKWFEIIGKSPSLTDESKSALEKELETYNKDGWVVTEKQFFDIWVNKDRTDAENAIRKKYTNVKPEAFADYFSFENVIVKAEEPVAAQQLYSTLDSVIQAVLTDKNADVAALVKQAAQDFEKNNLSDKTTNTKG